MRDGTYLFCVGRLVLEKAFPSTTEGSTTAPDQETIDFSAEGNIGFTIGRWVDWRGTGVDRTRFGIWRAR